MNHIKLTLTILLMALSVGLMAQTKKVQDVEKDNARAKVELVNGQRVLVLKTGRTAAIHNPDIVIKIEANTWKKFDDLVTGPWGNSIVVKDIYGYKVDIAKANVNSEVGLMFTSGTKRVALTKEEIEAIMK